MACIKKTKTNESDSELIKTLEEIHGNEYKAEASYAYFDVPDSGTSAFIDEFGNYLEGYGTPEFHGRVDDNGEPKLFYDEIAKKHYFINKNKEHVFFPIIKKGLRAIFDYKQIDRIVSRLALNYFKKSDLNFNNINFEEGNPLPNLKKFVQDELEIKIKQLQTEGVKGKIMAKHLTKSLDYVDEFVDKIDSFYKQINIKRVDNEGENESGDLQTESEKGKDPSFGKASFEQDTKDSLSNNTKLRLSLLENTDQLDPVWNEPTFVGFNEVYSTLVNNITNQVVLPGEDIFDIQRNIIQKISHKKPYLKQLINFFNNKRFTELDKNQFSQAFNLHKNNFLITEVKRSVVTDEVTKETEKFFKTTVKQISDSGSKASIVSSEWGNNFKDTFLTEDNRYKEGAREEIQKIVERLEELKTRFKDDINENEFALYSNEFITIGRSIGLELTESGFNNHLDENGSKAFDKEFQKKKLSNTISQAILALNKTKTSFKKASPDFANPFDTQSAFKELAKAESFFLSEGSDASIWSSGKNKWLYSYPSYLSTRILQWKKDPTILENWYNQSQYNKGSRLMKFLLALDVQEKDEFENKIKYEGGIEAERKRVSRERLDKFDLGVFNTFQEKNKDQVSADEISFNDYFTDHLNKVLTSSYVRTTTQADKGTNYQIRTGFFQDTTTMKRGVIGINEDTLDMFFDYFNSELQRMKEAHAEVDASKNNPENLKIHYHFKAGSNPFAKNGNAFNSQYFLELSPSVVTSDRRANSIKDQLYNQDGSIKHISDVKNNEALKQEIKDYIEAKLRTGVENTISTFLTQEVIELSATDATMKNKMIDRDVFKKYMDNNALNSNEAVWSAASDFYINGLIQNIEYSKMFTGDVAFYKNLTDYKKRVPATYTDGLQLRLKKGEENFNIAVIESIERESPVIDKLVEMLGEEGAKPYRKINSADAQAWITPQRWKFLGEKLGKWSPEHDAVYEKMLSDESEVYTKEELKIMAQPMKGVYFYMNGKTPTYLKYSQAVLTKGLVKGTTLENVYNKMTQDENGKTLDYNSQVHEIITIDGVKVGAPTPTKIHNEDGTVIATDKIKLNVASLSNYGWKLQQDLPVKTFKQIDVGSQIQKNIFAGLNYNSKISGFVLDGKETNGKVIAEEITRTVKSLIDKGVADLSKEFGIGKDGKIKNVKGLYGALIRELESRGGSKNMIDALNKETALYGMPQSMDKIISIYSSIMNDRLIKIKTNGGAFIQMSNFGIQKDNTVKQNIIWSPALENGDTTFEPERYVDEETGRVRIRPGGILISGSFIAKHIPDYKKYTPEQLFGYKDENGNFVKGMIDKRILENVIGYRIPNQGLSSNDSLQIVGILPEENGDTIVAYTGITTKTGSDFDIDKMFIMMPNFDYNKDSETGRESLDYTEYTPGLMNAKQSKEALQNRLIETYKAVLTHPKVIKDVMKPVDIAFIEEDIKDLMPIDTTGFMFHFDSYNDIKLRYDFISGKAGVGQEANALVDINRPGKLSFNKYYIGWGHSQERNKFKETILDEEFSENLSKEDENYYVEEMREFYKKQKKEFNEQSFRKSITNIPIGSSLTAILNAFVDIAKDPYISRGNWTTSTTNTGNLLLRAGVNPLYVTAFMAQPIIKQYVEYQASLESITSKNTGDTKNKFRRNLIVNTLKEQSQETPFNLLYQKLVKSASSGYGNLKTDKGKTILKKELGKDVSDEMIQNVLDFLIEEHDKIFNSKKIDITEKDKNGNPIYNLEYFRNQIKDSDKLNGAFQIAVYEKFLELQEMSKAVRENVNVSKLDTSGMGKNISSVYAILNLKQYILDKELSDKPGALNGFASKFEKTTLNNYLTSMKEMMRIIQANPKLFPQGQQKVQNMFNEIYYDLYDKPADDIDVMADFEKNYYTYVMSQFSPFNFSKEDAQDLISNLPNEFKKLKEANKGKYLILDELQIKRDGKFFSIALNNRKKSASFEEKFTDSWRDLRIDNPDFAEKLIKYSFLTSGFRMNANQFYTYIPNEYMLQEGINTFVGNFTSKEQTDFIDKFYLNNTHNFKYVRKVFDDVLVPSKDHNSGFILKEAGKARYYIQRENGQVFKLEGYNQENKAIYIRVEPLGKKYQGGVVVDFGERYTGKGIEGLNNEFIAGLKDKIVTPRDKFNPNFVLEKIEDRVEEQTEEVTEPTPELNEEFKAPEKEEVKEVSPHPIEIGRAVQYKTETYIVTQINENGTIQIYNPLLSGSVAKISVKPSNLTALAQKAKIVTYEGSEYIVTPKGVIISLTSNRQMMWADNHKDRLNILSLAENGVLAPETIKVDTAPVNNPSVQPAVFKPANKQQEVAINVIQDFIDNGNPDEILVIEGKAGTGKTTIVQEAIAPAVAKGKRILIAALSHKAKLVLADKLNARYPGRTSSGSIAGILGMKMDMETGEFEEVFGEDAKIKQADIIIIDEASMVNEDALMLMLEAKRRNAKLIFLGDRGQLPPIRKQSSDEISPVFESENKASLTERVRQGEESPILPFADYYWDNSELDKPSFNPVPDNAYKDVLTDKGNLVFAPNMKSVFDDVVNTFRKGILEQNPNVIKIVTYRNATRKSYNEAIRKEIFGRDVEQFVQNDIIMFQDGYKTVDEDFSNSDEFSISEIRPITRLGFKAFEIGVKRNPKSDRMSYFPVIAQEDEAAFNKAVSDLFAAAKGMPKGSLRTQKFKDAWALKASFANIDYSYAITSHKSQGSTYDYVIVDAEDINSVGMTSIKSKSRSIYTGITRARTTAIILKKGIEVNQNNIAKSLSDKTVSKLSKEEQDKLDEIKKYCNGK